MDLAQFTFEVGDFGGNQILGDIFDGEVDEGDMIILKHNGMWFEWSKMDKLDDMVLERLKKDSKYLKRIQAKRNFSKNKNKDNGNSNSGDGGQST